MQLFVGLSAHRGSIKRYPFDILELPIAASLPKPKTLKEIKKSRPDVAFSLRLSPEVVTSGVEHPDVTRASIARDCLGAQVIVIATGPRFTPTTRNHETLRALADVLRTDTCHVAWEPRGVFSQREAERWAGELNVMLVRDLTREPRMSAPIQYTRLLGIGFGSRVTQHAAETLVGQLEGCQTAYVVVGGEGAKNLRNQLREWLGLGASGTSSEEDWDEGTDETLGDEEDE